MGTGIISRKQSGRGMKLTTHFYLVPRLRVIAAILPLFAFMEWKNVTFR